MNKAKLSLLFVALLNFNALIAQTQWIGVQIGYEQPILRENIPGEKKLSNTTTLNGAKIGLIYDATLIKGFGFTLGVNYGISGNHSNWYSKYSTVYPRQKDKNVLHTIEVPIDWQYKFEIAKETYLILYTGPSIKYNFRFTTQPTEQSMEGKGAITETKGKTTSRYDMDIDADGQKDYTPLNISWNLGGGFQYKNYYLRGGYDFGIYYPYKDAYSTSSTTGDLRRRGRFDEWSIRIGIYFLNF